MTAKTDTRDMTENNTTEHYGEPVLDYASKKVMLVAEHGDTIHIDGHGEMTVHERTEPYFGPNLKLHDDETSYRLVAPGFAHDLELWKAITDDGYVKGWERVGEVTAEIVDVAASTVCECGETISTLRERQAAAVGVCIHG